VGQRECRKSHKITGADLKGFITYFRNTSAGEYVKELLVNVMTMKLGGFSARFYSYQVHAKCLKSQQITQGSGMPNGVGIELMNPDIRFHFCDVNGP
jgi:hypothetical protein